MAKKKKKGKSASDKLLDRYQRARDKKPAMSFKSYTDPEKTKDLTFWKPQIGEHTFYIVEYTTGEQDLYDDPGEPTHCCELFVHKNVGPRNDMYLCLNEHGEPNSCPICTERERLRREGEDDDVVNALWPQRRTMYNVVVTTNSEEIRKGVQVFDVWFDYMEKELLRKAQKAVSKKKRAIEPNINFASKKSEGKIIQFERGEKKVKIRGKRATIPTFEDHEFIDRDEPVKKKYLEAAVCLDELLYIPTSEEVSDAFFADRDRSEGKKKRKSDRKRDRRGTSKKKSKIKKIDDFDNEEELREYLENLSYKKLVKFIEDNDLEIDLDDFEEDDEESVIDAVITFADFEGEEEDEEDDDEPEDDDDEEEEEDDDEGEEDEEDDEEEDDENECPSGYQFGVDTDTEEECQECPEETWEKCLSLQQKAEKKKKRSKRK